MEELQQNKTALEGSGKLASFLCDKFKLKKTVNARLVRANTQWEMPSAEYSFTLYKAIWRNYNKIKLL
jgi:hypothetical protein